MAISKKFENKRKTEGSVKSKISRGIKYYESSGNVFKDMGKSDDQANNLLLRGDLMIEIERTIKGRSCTHGIGFFMI